MSQFEDQRRKIELREQRSARESIETRSYERNGVLYWESNDQVVPPFVVLARLPCGPAA